MMGLTAVEVGTFCMGALLTALLLALGHWFPWPGFKLSRLQAYLYGVASLWVGFALWRGLNGDWLTPAGLAVLAAIGGAVTRGAYWFDGVVVEIRQGKKAGRVDRDLLRDDEIA